MCVFITGEGERVFALARKSPPTPPPEALVPTQSSAELEVREITRIKREKSDDSSTETPQSTILNSLVNTTCPLRNSLKQCAERVDRLWVGEQIMFCIVNCGVSVLESSDFFDSHRIVR